MDTCHQGRHAGEQEEVREREESALIKKADTAPWSLVQATTAETATETATQESDCRS